MMHIRSGLVGLKSENVKKHWSSKGFFLTGQAGLEHPDAAMRRARRGGFWWKSNKKQAKRRKMSLATGDGTNDAYMFGVGGCKKRKCQKPVGFKCFFEGSSRT